MAPTYDFNLSLLEHIYANEKKYKDKVYFTQPYGDGVVKDTTWGEALQEARKMATYLKSFGFEDGAKIGMISKNCDKFIIAEIAIWMAGYTTVAIFPNTNEKTVRYCLEQSDARLLFVGKLDGYEGLAPGFPEDMPKVVLPLAPAEAQAESEWKKWDEVMAEAEPMEGEPVRADDDLALFIYTSGSTGTPKGVMHAFGPMKAAITGIVKTNGRYMDSTTRALSYLPLAHVFERCYVECVSFVIASHLFFAESLATFVNDLQRCQPTVFISVPRLWLKFQQGVFKKLPEKKLNRLLSIPIVSTLVKRKLLKGLGLDKVKLAGSGSAAIPAPVLAWYRRIGLNLYEGYAMSEDFAYSHLSKKGFARVGYVGVPYPGVEVKIGEGDEILIKSPGAMVGYYKMEEKTKDSFTEDGFFKTGDRGQREANGLLKITGRLKELFKTSKGKYISPAPIENVINADALVGNSLVGGADQPQPYAQLVLAEDIVEKIGDESVKADVNEKLLALLEATNASLEHHEHMNFFVVASDEWTTENGCLTPTQKIKRSAIEDMAAPKVDGWYERAAAGEKIIWD